MHSAGFSPHTHPFTHLLYSKPVTGERELTLVSESQEIEMGWEAAPSLNWAYGGVS